MSRPQFYDGLGVPLWRRETTHGDRTGGACYIDGGAAADPAEGAGATGSAINEMLSKYMQRRDERLLGEVIARLDALERPDPRSRLDPEPPPRAELGAGGEEGIEQEPDVGTPERSAWLDRQPTIVSRHQPTDPLYRGLYQTHPEFRTCRTADSDHWVAQWILGLAEKDKGRMQRCNAEIAAIMKRNTVLIGTPPAAPFPAGTGGALIPIPLLSSIMINRDIIAKIRRMAFGVTLTSVQARIPTAGQATAAMVAEAADLSARNDEPAFASVLPVANKMVAYVKLSREQINDSAFNAVSLVAQRVGSRFGALEDEQACTSSGAAPNFSDQIGDGSTTAAITPPVTLANLITLYFSLGQAYRAGAAFFAGSSVLEILTGKLDTNGRPIFFGVGERVGTVNDDSDGSMFRRPVFEVPAPAGFLWFANLGAHYGFCSRQGIEAAVSEHVLFATDLIALKFTQRVDGVVLDAPAAKERTGITS